MNPVTQGLAVHPGQPRGACPIHPFQSVGDRDQPGADATIALPSRLSAQLLRTNVITDRQSRYCGSPLLRPQHLLLSKSCRCNFLWRVSVNSGRYKAPCPNPRVGTEFYYSAFTFSPSINSSNSAVCMPRRPSRYANVIAIGGCPVRSK